ncbi:probable transmembrane GTPase FZO-like, chloroplastic [Phalaenopsis equestris]|uniref:probable transmembrane GTPase FZO-like, chloroplastic n=1 Tax=Phalaenopsis equestris TaxID=78828 RepID=UPI0009E4A694|nr:probable transmembrane GTPase FZO-like, chloroplastic [Phalaenopsis equestris]
MVSIPCSYSVAARLPRFSDLSETHFPNLSRHARFHKCRSASGPITAVGTNSSGTDPLDGKPQPPRTLFPGGFKRPEIKIPSLVLRLGADEVLRWDDAGAALGEAISMGVGIVVLDVGEQSGGRLYEAACLLKSALGDRAYLLISERVDVAAAVGAGGVVLSDQGIPAIVARNMLSKSKSDAVFLPIVAREVHNAISAEHAASSDGADFIIICNGSGNWKRVIEESFTHYVKVPIFLNMESSGDSLAADVLSKLLQLGASGVVISTDSLKLFSNGYLEKIFLAKHGSIRVLQDGFADSSKMKVDGFTSMFNMVKGIAGFMKLDDKEIKLLEMESLLLKEAIAVIHKAAPMMSEVALLVDAASRLKEPFLMVIVGEFNSGKSTVINALLGRRYLKEGVVPTTNEITLLCYSKTDSNKEERCERNPDGQFICYVSSPILKNMNLVDTPGTNVILQRQQRLTEEFVPRADLVLFVISSDRPLTGSEVSFLQYVQQWKKKVVFVLNKMDLYQNSSELEEATVFIKENTQKLLGIGDLRLYPVSARSALEAKLSALSFNARNYEELLYNDPRWISSKFGELENFLYSFLDGSTDTGMERMKLKLETPVAIAERLLDSSERLLLQQQDEASHDLISIKEVVGSTKDYAMKMENESLLWKKKVVSMIEAAESQAVELMESTLQLSNIDLITTYAFKGEKSRPIASTSTLQNEIIIPALSGVQRLLGEYSEWLQCEFVSEGELCLERLQKQCNKGLGLRDVMQANTVGLTEHGEKLSTKVMEDFSASAASRLCEQEIREVVYGTFGGLGAAGLSASLLTSVLPTTLEDLVALAFCSAGGFLAISNFPARRREAIQKVRKVADKLAIRAAEAMQTELLHASERLHAYVEFISKPYQDSAQQRVDSLLATGEELAATAKQLQHLKAEIQTLHVLQPRARQIH